MVSNEGTTRLIKAIRSQSKKVFDINGESNKLGTLTGDGIVLDGIEEVIPRSEFLVLQTPELVNTGGDSPCRANALKPGDRVLCVPCGNYFVVVGKVM